MNNSLLRYRSLLAHELEATTTLMLRSIQTFPSEIHGPIHALIEGGGKRLRPALVILSAYMCGAPFSQVIPVAAAVEMLHTATLIHDDLIDHAETRRGQQTLNRQLVPAATVLAGDAIFSVAAKLATQSRNPIVVQRFAETLETICVGEISQMVRDKTQPPTLETYYQRIFAKTASLFALCTESGALLAGCPLEQVNRSRRVGRLMGEAFQITDDVLDIVGDETQLGKPIAADLRQGLITLPVLYYLQKHPGDERIQEALKNHLSEQSLNTLAADIKNSEAPRQAMQQAEGHIREAGQILTGYPDSVYRQAMEELASFAVRRRY